VDDPLARGSLHALTEAAGAGLLSLRWAPDLGADRAVYAGAFHAVSAFCNAGFSLWPTSLIRFRADPLVNLVVGALITLGGSASSSSMT
jgi:trk/ktr system potassium uptake protein